MTESSYNMSKISQLPIENSVELDSNYPSFIERYFETYYFIPRRKEFERRKPYDSISKPFKAKKKYNKYKWERNKYKNLDVSKMETEECVKTDNLTSLERDHDNELLEMKTDDIISESGKNIELHERFDNTSECSVENPLLKENITGQEHFSDTLVDENRNNPSVNESAESISINEDIKDLAVNNCAEKTLLNELSEDSHDVRSSETLSATSSNEKELTSCEIVEGKGISCVKNEGSENASKDEDIQQKPTGLESCIHIHSNHICLVTLSHHHPIVTKKMKIKEIDFQVGSQDRLKVKVSGKGKKGGQRVAPNSVICFLVAEDNSEYAVCAGLSGKLIEINKRLLRNPSLIVTDPEGDGYIAVVLPRLNDLTKIKAGLIPKDKYEMFFES